MRLEWPVEAIQRFHYAWAKSTLSSYNSVLNKCRQYCVQNNHRFPPSETKIIAGFLCDVANKSRRPKSILGTACAALSMMYKALGLYNYMKDTNVMLLVDSLVKSGTESPLVYSKVMPISNFHDLFNGWKNNEELNVRDVRLKCITLLALSAMLRPSDIAPKAQTYDCLKKCSKQVVFSTDNIEFQEDGSVKIKLFGIKNDSQRTGFEIVLPPAKISKLDPVSTLKYYINVTYAERSNIEGNPVFLTLRKPYKALDSKGVAEILNNAINLAGLGGKGYSAKDFRPTGATVAVQCGVDNEVARKLGRWKTSEVFFSRYVHQKPPESYTTDLLNFS